MKLLVTGASGQLGRAVIQQLLKHRPAGEIAVMVRDAEKVPDLKATGVVIHTGDYNDPASLENAMHGVDRVLLIAGTDEEKRLQQHKNVVDAAKKSGVQFIAYTSRCLKDPETLVNKLMLGHFQTEAYIRDSGLTYALFRNILYMDTIPNFVGEQVFETGIQLPIDRGQVAFALRAEMGEAIANVLAADAITENKLYKLTGSELVSFEDIAAALTELSGKEVNYTAIAKSAFELKLTEKGLPPVVIGRITGFLTDIANGQESEVTADLQELLGRKPASLREGLKVLYQL
jgi:NAD(P)H dehydrogenase (quinone)